MSEKKVGHLVINRKAGETVRIGECQVTPYFHKRNRSQIVLMIEAPLEIPVSRVHGVNVPPRESNTMSLKVAYHHPFGEGKP